MSFISVLGYHTTSPTKFVRYLKVTGWNHNSSSVKLVPKKTKLAPMFLNTLNLLGYAPLVGVLPAAIRWGAAYHTWDQKNIRSLNYGMIARGTLEILGAGSLLIIPDLIVSIERHLRSGNPTQLI